MYSSLFTKHVFKTDLQHQIEAIKTQRLKKIYYLNESHSHNKNGRTSHLVAAVRLARVLLIVEVLVLFTEGEPAGILKHGN